MIKKLSIEGFRGFITAQDIEFAIPNGKDGSGITFIVGENNSGKTSIIEAIRAFNDDKEPSFSSGQRNILAQSKIKLVLYPEKGSEITIRTIDEGGCFTTRSGKLNKKYTYCSQDDLLIMSFYLIHFQEIHILIIFLN